MDEGTSGNREVIIDRALALFSARGYDAVGVQEIVEAANVTKPTLYHYFESKRGLLDALIEREGAELVATIGSAAAYSGDLPLTLDRVAFALTGFASKDPAFYRFLLGLYFAPPESEAKMASLSLLTRLTGIFETLFEAASHDHGNMKGRQRGYAAAFFGTLNTTIGLFLVGSIELTDDLVRNSVRRFMYGIFS
jgi:TetR/AcrR family transcriptional regulator